MKYDFSERKLTSKKFCNFKLPETIIILIFNYLQLSFDLEGFIFTLAHWSFS